MPSLEQHIKASMERTGKSYREVHEWIDNPEYKNERHDITKVFEFGEIIKEKHGEEGAQEYLYHISDDIHCRFENVANNIKNNLKYFGLEK
jgi:hypothetical protein